MTAAQQPESSSHQLWVIDTSSLLAVRETYGASRERAVFAVLSKYATHCSERAADPATIRKVLAKVPELLDVDNPNEQADCYVLAVAVDLNVGGFDVCVVTDDRRDKGQHISLATATGMFRLPNVPLHAFVRGEGLLE